MAVWLKCGAAEFAFDQDIVPREAMSRLVLLADIEAGASAAAEALRAAARTDAEAIADKARRDAAAVTRLGHAQGRRDALRHWHAEAGAQRAAAAARHGSLREQLAGMVAQATASLLQGPLLDAYLDAALRALDALAEKDQALSLTVHPLDRPVAQVAIDRLREHWREGTVVKLLEDESLARGGCICESPQGYIDASLSLQLATLRQAAMGALEGLELPDDVLQPSPDESQGAAPEPVAAPAGAAPAGPVPNPYEAYMAAHANRLPRGFDDEDDFDGEDDDEDSFEDGPGDGFDPEDSPSPGRAAAAPRPRMRRPW